MADDGAGGLGLFEAIYSTRALRRIKPDPVPDEVLFQLFDAAIRAPSGGNAQDWRFVVITEPALKQTIQGWFWEAWTAYQPRYAADPSLMDALPRSQRLSLRSTDYLVRHLAEVPVILAVCGLRGKHSTPGGSIFPAVQNLLLAARALGIGGTITTLHDVVDERVKALFGIPASAQIVYCVPLGYPRGRFGPTTRKPLAEVAAFERWDGSVPW